MKVEFTNEKIPIQVIQLHEGTKSSQEYSIILVKVDTQVLN